MALLKFFRVPKNQKFDYIPRYYDAKHEDLHRRIKVAKQAKDGDPDALKARISTGFNRKSKSYRSTGTSHSMRRNLFLLALIAGLFLITYLLLNVYLPRIIQMFE